MMRSLFSCVAGLRNHQLKMDVIGNNIANVNTIGFKKSRVTFQDTLSQTIRGATSPRGNMGGSNPQQIGLGVAVSTIDVLHTQGSSETTGKITDLMIDGDGFFIVGDGRNNFFTRAGNFDFDRDGNLVNPDGLLVMGWMADNTGNINTMLPIGRINIPRGKSIQPRATTSAVYVNNLDSGMAVDSYWDTILPVYDSQGNEYAVTIRFTKRGVNTWDVTTTTAGFTLPPGLQITFKPDGTFNSVVGGPAVLTATPPGVNPIRVNLDFSQMTQFASPCTARYNTQDGYTSGVLEGYSIDTAGVITGRFSNGLTQKLAQVALANFNNPAGLLKMGGNLYAYSNNSGDPQIGPAGTGGRGDIGPGKIEMSNVDLSEEFTQMIITQRGFQANSRIITTSDEMLQELVNLKR